MANGVGLRILSLVVLEFKSPPLHHGIYYCFQPDRDLKGSEKDYRAVYTSVIIQMIKNTRGIQKVIAVIELNRLEMPNLPPLRLFRW